VLRTAAFFSPFDKHNFAKAVVNVLRVGDRFTASGQHSVTPTYVPHLAHFALDLLIDGGRGLWHVSNGHELSWLEFGRTIASACGLDATKVVDASAEELGWIAPRPPRCGLTTRRGQMLPPLSTAIDAFAAVNAGRLAA
jgi:dTDP-4-dehydrorhamnose reductase